jgi:hypothetical protein
MRGFLWPTEFLVFSDFLAADPYARRAVAVRRDRREPACPAGRRLAQGPRRAHRHRCRALAARPDAAEVGRRHAGYYRALAEQADRPLRSPGESQWLERLQAETATWPPRCAGTWPMTLGRLPHLFRVLWLFWTREDLEREAVRHQQQPQHGM